MFHEKFDWYIISPDIVILEVTSDSIYTMVYNGLAIEKIQYQRWLFRSIARMTFG